jgi:lactoylglutathione lyase
MKRGIQCLVLSTVVAFSLMSGGVSVTGQQEAKKQMQLGNFSVSLAVKDLKASREFYEKLGFRMITGDGRKWAIMQNDTATIGLFEGIFEKNSLTFNPGWDRNSATLPKFDDVRSLQQMLKSRGVKLVAEADESGSGPASFAISDPDGNPILVDQHVPKPAG